YRREGCRLFAHPSPVDNCPPVDNSGPPIDCGQPALSVRPTVAHDPLAADSLVRHHRDNLCAQVFPELALLEAASSGDEPAARMLGPALAELRQDAVAYPDGLVSALRCLGV